MFEGLLQPTHLIILLIIGLLVLGPKRLPEVGRSLGHGMRSFKDAVTSSGDDDEPDAAQVTATTADETPAEVA